MITITLAEIAQYRSQLAENSAAQQALDMIEDCEGDLEDAAIALALRAGQEPDRSDQWLDGLAKQWRAFVCQADIREQLLAGSVVGAVQVLSADTTIPDELATPVVIYVLKTGVEEFCKPLQEML